MTQSALAKLRSHRFFGAQPHPSRVEQGVSFFCASAIFPTLLGSFGDDGRRLLLFQIVKIGGVAITPIFLIKAVVFLIALVLLSKFVQRYLVSRALRHVHISDSARFAFGRFTTYLLFLGGLFVGLQSLGVNLNSLVVFGGAIGVGVGLGLQNVVSNFVAGLILLIEQPIRIGDRIDTDGTQGDVVRIVPNSNFINNSVTNWTANDPTVRISVPVGVGYNSDPERVRTILLQAAMAHPDVLSQPQPDVVFTSYGDNSLNFTLRVWTISKSHISVVLRSDLYFDLFRRFTEAGIELPFPQRDLHIRSSEIPIPFPGNDGAPKI
jgi:small-conductance mechanosensitive channel